METLEPIVLYGHKGTPNPVKVQIVLEELGLPYVCRSVEISDMKKEPYLSVNPNGRVPAFEDANTGVTMFESGAIIQYLVNKYDDNKKLDYESWREKAQVVSWLHFQMSGQSPMFGQRAWFLKLHPERIESVLLRYGREIKRVLGVIDAHLQKQGTTYLVGDKVTVADLAFVPWNDGLHWIMAERLDWAQEFPVCHAWHERLMSRPSVKKVLRRTESVTEKA